MANLAIAMYEGNPSFQRTVIVAYMSLGLGHVRLSVALHSIQQQCIIIIINLFIFITTIIIIIYCYYYCCYFFLLLLIEYIGSVLLYGII